MASRSSFNKLPVDDPYVNSLGAKGAGKLGIFGVAPAVANAVYRANGSRSALPNRA